MGIENQSKTGETTSLAKALSEMRKPQDAAHVVEKAAVQQIEHKMSDAGAKELANRDEDGTFKEVREAAGKVKEVSEKIIEAAAIAVPGGQVIAAEAVLKETAKRVAKEIGKAAVKEVASQAIDATESESLQRIKGKLVDASVATVEKGVDGVDLRRGGDVDRMPTESPSLRIKQTGASDIDTVNTVKKEQVEAKTGRAEEQVCGSHESEVTSNAVDVVVDVESNTVAEDAVENTGGKNLTNDALEGENDTIETTENCEPLNAELGSETKDALPPNVTVEIDGRKCETDDNGKIYAVDGKLMPNVEYSLNEFKYRTDEHGRIVHVEGEVKLTDKARDHMPEMSSKDKKDTDDKGHVIGHQIGGLEKIGNLVPQDFNLNRGEYKKLENELARLAKDGHDVRVEVSLKYKDGMDRPDTFRVKYTVDGKTYVKVFKNESSKNGGNQ